jgi:hypothetical protein
MRPSRNRACHHTVSGALQSFHSSASWKEISIMATVLATLSLRPSTFAQPDLRRLSSTACVGTMYYSLQRNYILSSKLLRTSAVMPNLHAQPVCVLMSSRCRLACHRQHPPLCPCNECSSLRWGQTQMGPNSGHAPAPCIRFTTAGASQLGAHNHRMMNRRGS